LDVPNSNSLATTPTLGPVLPFKPLLPPPTPANQPTYYEQSVRDSVSSASLFSSSKRQNQQNQHQYAVLRMRELVRDFDSKHDDDGDWVPWSSKKTRSEFNGTGVWLKKVLECAAFDAVKKWCA